MGVTQGAGLSLQWMRKTLMPEASYDDMTREAAKAPPGAHGLFWLPYLMGERTPHLDPQARGGWIGLTARHERADLLRSLIEGVSFSQRDCLELIEEMGVEIQSVRLSGGGAQSQLWRQMLSDVFNKRVTTLATQEGSAYGAALLAMVGGGAFRSVEEACSAAIRETGAHGPVAHTAQTYERLYQVYRSLYPALKPVYGLIAGL
jgi:xylulokinase